MVVNGNKVIVTRDQRCQSKASGSFSTLSKATRRDMWSCSMVVSDFGIVLVSLLAVCSSVSTGVSTEEKTTSLQCKFNGEEGCQGCKESNKTCAPGEFCFASQANQSNGPKMIKGCWIKSTHNCNVPHCELSFQMKRSNNVGMYFCCCNGNFCNANLTMAPSKPTRIETGLSVKSTQSPNTPPETTSPSKPSQSGGNFTINTLLYSVLPIFGIAVVLLFGFIMYHRHRTAFPTRICEEEPLHSFSPPSPVLSIRPIQLVEVISQGQFGTVWKANYLQDLVAVKVFPPAHKGAWVCEKEFYTSCNLKDNNVLKFVAIEKHTDGQYTEFWLITEYHEHGSLSDYLKGHVVTWKQLCGMVESMASGLAYLHSEVPGPFSKPCIAHRDVKSKNILVKEDLTCCLSDFGLAMKFKPGGDPGETHGQVGTRRYMAPEVLEGAINFTRESFLRIDMYAFALVLWEVTSRCTAADGPVDDYRLPFDNEVGAHPSLEDMQQVVVQKKIRPTIRPDWHNHLGMASLVQTFDECWDQDAEARLTAQCVVERVAQLNTLSSNVWERTPVVTTVVNHTETSTSSKESTI